MYTVLRVGLVLVLLAVLLLLGINPFWATGLAVVLALPISYLALDGPRRRFSQELAERKAHPEKFESERQPGRADAAEEDALLDELDTASPASAEAAETAEASAEQLPADGEQHSEGERP